MVIRQAKALSEYLRHAEIPYLYNAVDRKRLEMTLGERLDAGVGFWKRTPILHFGMHGSENGVQLMDQRDRGEVISWQELAELICPIHTKLLPNGLGVCMSSCEGMAHSFVSAPPFQCLVGFGSNIAWRDLPLAYTVYYRRYQKGLGGPELINAVRAASGILDFDVAEVRQPNKHMLPMNLRKQ